jgi:hypothetical protein
MDDGAYMEHLVGLDVESGANIVAIAVTIATIIEHQNLHTLIPTAQYWRHHP